jgi:hypothetical protein
MAARPTGGALTTAGFSATGTVYAKVTGTATAKVDLAGTSTGGHVEIGNAVPGVPMAAADWASHVATLGTLGINISKLECPLGLVSYSQTI